MRPPLRTGGAPGGNAVFVTGIGALCPLGTDMEQIRTAREAGEQGVYPHEDYGMPCGAVDESFDVGDFTDTTYHYIDRATAFAIAAVKMAKDDAGGRAGDEAGVRTGLVLGTVWGCTATMETFQEKLLASEPRFAAPFLFSQSFPNSPASVTSIEFGIRGYNTVYAGCRNAGFMALMTACDAVYRGRADAVFAVGTDALSRTVADHHRNGSPPGEGAACLLIEREPHGGEPVAVAKWGMRAFPGRDSFSGEIIPVRDNLVAGAACGNLLGAAFPFAAVLAVDRIRRGLTEEALVTYEGRYARGYCLLRGRKEKRAGEKEGGVVF